MCKSVKILLIFALVAVNVVSAGAEVLLLNKRIDREEITEIRFTVPPGCVITGLGFRAHQDNITTMHCRYHKLTADGRLIDPKEVRLGYEPDHDCEAKIYLPDGWVAVGFGAAAEPEWDVTLLRVWARRLSSDGTLGELKVFNDGFKPTREPERFVLLAEPDRVLTGAGLRFHFNDIIGIYASSQQILQIDASAKAKIRGLTISAWYLDGIDGLDSEKLFADVNKYEVRDLFLRVYNGSSLTSMSNLGELCRKANVSVFIHVPPDFTKQYLENLVRSVGPEGIVIDPTLSSTTRLNVIRYVDLAKEICRKLQCKVYLYLDRPLKRLPSDIGIVLGKDVVKSGCFESIDLTGREIVAELEVSQSIALAAGVPDVRLDELQSQVIRLASAGVKRFAVNVWAGGNYLLDGSGKIALDGARILIKDPYKSTDEIWDKLSTLWYGGLAPQCKGVLQQVVSANDLVFKVLGLDLLWFNGKLVGLARIEEELQELAHSHDQRSNAVARELLRPTDGTVSRVELEGETAKWLIKQAVDTLGSIVNESKDSKVQKLFESVKRLDKIAAISNLLSRTVALTLLYAQDAAPSTLNSVNSAVMELEKTASESTAYLGSGCILDGLDSFLKSVRESLDYSSTNAPIARAFNRVSSLSKSAGSVDKAAQELVNIMESEEFAPYIDKHWHTIGKLATNLPALGCYEGTLQILWGGDGRWKLEKIAGRWCMTTSKTYPCVYLDVLNGLLDKPSDFVVTFEYFDEGNWEVHFEYDSDYPADQGRQYHKVEPLKLTNTKTWKEASFTLSNCLFSSGQNLGADMRFVSGNGIRIRNVKLLKG
jgi:hypothetical protein